MTKEFEILLSLFGDSSLGRKTKNIDIENPDKIVEMSAKQGIWSCIYPNLSSVCDVSKYQLDFLAHVSKGIARNEFTLNILSEAMEKGIDVCLVKGVVAASLYAVPDYRISADTDILIKPSDEKKISEFLSGKGYTVEKRKKHDHHMKARHPIGGLLEVHVSLNSELSYRLAFNEKFNYNDSWQEITVNNHRLYTLSIRDNLNFLTAHYIRHFLHGGSSIRQMMDLLLYMDKYKDGINMAEYDSLMEELKYKKLIDTVKSIGAKYFGMNFELCSDEDMNVLLEDCEKCGLFGKSTKYTTNVASEFYNKRAAKSSLKIKLLFWFKSENPLIDRIFPRKSILIKMGYSYADKGYLIPIAWVHKMFDYVFKRNKVRNESINPEVMNERIETMRNLYIID